MMLMGIIYVEIQIEFLPLLDRFNLFMSSPNFEITDSMKTSSKNFIESLVINTVCFPCQQQQRRDRIEIITAGT